MKRTIDNTLQYVFASLGKIALHWQWMLVTKVYIWRPGTVVARRMQLTTFRPVWSSFTFQYGNIESYWTVLHSLWGYDSDGSGRMWKYFVAKHGWSSNVGDQMGLLSRLVYLQVYEVMNKVTQNKSLTCDMIWVWRIGLITIPSEHLNRQKF